jgi:RHS repeat-associated protein
MVDGSGSIVARYAYDSYGKITVTHTAANTSTPPIDATFTFDGYLWHQASGLYLMWWRLYDALTGRWLSRDRIGERGGMNLYGYVFNSPVILTDPDGKSPLVGPGSPIDADTRAHFFIFCKCRCETKWRLVRVEISPGLASGRGGTSITFGPSTIHTYPSNANQILNPPPGSPVYSPTNPATPQNAAGAAATLAHECGHTCQAKKLGPLYLPVAAAFSGIEEADGGYNNGLNGLTTPTESGASANGEFGGVATPP